MGLFDHVKTFVYGSANEQSPIAQSAPSTKVAASVPAAMPKASAPPVIAPSAPPTGSDEVSPEFRAIVEERVAKAAEPAFSAFQRLEATLKGIIQDGATRVQAVIASIKAQGQSIEQLVIDIEECDTELVAIRGEVDAHFNDRITDEVTAKKQRAEAKQTEITELQQKIAELGQEIITLNGEASSGQIAIEAERGNALRYIDKHRYDLSQIAAMIKPHATPAPAPSPSPSK